MTIEIYADGRKIKDLKAGRVDVTARVLQIAGITGRDRGCQYEAFYVGEIHFELKAEILYISFTDPSAGKYIEIQCYDW